MIVFAIEIKPQPHSMNHLCGEFALEVEGVFPRYLAKHWYVSREDW